MRLLYGLSDVRKYLPPFKVLLMHTHLLFNCLVNDYVSAKVLSWRKLPSSSHQTVLVIFRNRASKSIRWWIMGW